MIRQTLITLMFMVCALSLQAQQTVLISNSGLEYTPDTVTVSTNDSVRFDVGATHPTLQVTFNAYVNNQTTAAPNGFNYATGSGAFLVSDVASAGDTLYFVCTSHVGAGMKGLIAVQGGAATSPARLLLVHNAPDPLADTVDIYLELTNGTELTKLEDVPYRAAAAYTSPAIDESNPTDVVVKIADNSSTSSANPVFSDTVAVTGGVSYVAVANGVADPSQGTGLDSDAALTIDVAEIFGNEPTANETGVVVHHGAADVPPVSVFNDANNTELVARAEYGQSTFLLTLAASDYNLRLEDADADTVIGGFDAPLSGLAQDTVVVFASGFLASGNVNAYNPESSFKLLAFAVQAGQVIELQPASVGIASEEAQWGGVSVYPTQVSQGEVQVHFDLPRPASQVQARILDVHGRELQREVWGHQSAGSATRNISVGELSEGMYLIQVQSDQGSRTARFQVIR